MRLFLSSFRLGNHPSRLRELAGDARRALVVLNACDFMSAADRQLRVDQETSALQGLGFDPVELDLRDYFASARSINDLRATLTGAGLVWVRGGNSFLLRRAFALSGLDTLLAGLLLQDALVYGGFSAGVAVLTPTLRGVELVDDIRATGDAYPIVADSAAEGPWDGLAILPYAVAPHYRSDHPESADVDRLVQYYIDHHIPFVALRDGEVIVIDAERTEVLT